MLALGNYLFLYSHYVENLLVSLLSNVLDYSPVVVELVAIELAQLPHLVFPLYLCKVFTNTICDLQATHHLCFFLLHQDDQLLVLLMF